MFVHQVGVVFVYKVGVATAAIEQAADKQHFFSLSGSAWMLMVCVSASDSLTTQHAHARTRGLVSHTRTQTHTWTSLNNTILYPKEVV